jgi:hypothetical protein
MKKDDAEPEERVWCADVLESIQQKMKQRQNELLDGSKTPEELLSEISEEYASEIMKRFAEIGN